MCSSDLCGRLSSFQEDFQSFDLLEDGSIKQSVIENADFISNQECNPSELDAAFNISSIYRALVTGIRDYFIKMGFKKAIIGSSGGIDSAVTIALAVEALGKENVTAILMPSVFSSSHSVTDAEELSKHLENPYHVLPIKSIND